jgi:hypothetical protein
MVAQAKITVANKMIVGPETTNKGKPSTSQSREALCTQQ